MNLSAMRYCSVKENTIIIFFLFRRKKGEKTAKTLTLLVMLCMLSAMTPTPRAENYWMGASGYIFETINRLFIFLLPLNFVTIFPRFLCSLHMKIKTNPIYNTAKQNPIQAMRHIIISYHTKRKET